MPIAEKKLSYPPFYLLVASLLALVGRFAFPIAQCKVQCRMVPVLRCSLQPAPCTLQPATATSQANASSSLELRRRMLQRRCPGGRACSWLRSTTCCCPARPPTRCYRRRRRVRSSRRPSRWAWARLLLADLDHLLLCDAAASPPPPPRPPTSPLSVGFGVLECWQWTVEPSERVEPRQPTTCASRPGRLIRSRATRHASGRGLIVDGMDPESTQKFFRWVSLPIHRWI